MRETLEWLQGISFRLMNMNEPNVPTREDNNGHASVIDLVFANRSASDLGSLSNIYINTEIGCLSDHHALTFTISPTQEETPTLLDNGLNWKHADEETFCEALREEIELNHAEHSALVRDLLNPNRKSASEMELDGAIVGRMAPCILHCSFYMILYYKNHTRMCTTEILEIEGRIMLSSNKTSSCG